MSLQISKNNTPVYDYFSTGDDSDPITRSVTLDGDGTPDASGELTAYLVATDFNYTGITVTVTGNPTGVTWEISLTSGASFGASVSPADMDALVSDQVTTLYMRATVVDDGSVSTSNIAAPKFNVSATENAA